MKVFIITEGNFKAGLGHIGRCISIYQAFKEKEIVSCFIINGDESIKDLLNGLNYICFNWIKNSKKLINIINQADIAIIDSYTYDDSLSKKISYNVKIPVYIDDNNRIEYPRGLVINSGLHAKYLDYPTNFKVQYLLGVQYSMLKKTFWEIKPKNIVEQINSILITFGGSDIRNLTPRLIKILKIKFPNIKKKIIIGKKYQNLKEIENLSDDRCELIYFPNSERLRDLMLSSDIAITAGGQTTYELASVGVPAITVAVADNQIMSVEKFNELGINYYAGWWEDDDLFTNILGYIQKLQNLKLRKELIDKGQKLIKSDGSRRIVDFIIMKLNDKKLKN